MPQSQISKSKGILNVGTSQGFEETLWLAADKLRNNVDTAQYKHIVLGLVFVKYLSDCCEKGKTQLKPKERGAGLPAHNRFRVPSKARWQSLQKYSKHMGIGKAIDDAMAALESANPALKGLLEKNYDRPDLDKPRLGELIDLIGTLALGTQANRSPDILGRVYEYFVSKFARAEGRRGSQYYTPPCVGLLLVEMLRPFKGRIYDPCCGTGGIFIHVKNFAQAHRGHLGDIGFYGQESNPTTWRLAKLNLAAHGLDGNLGSENADTFRRDLHEDLNADYILANPPFNDSDWAGDLELKNDARWKYGTPPVANANFAWVQHFIYHLAPDGFAGFLLTNGSLSNNRSGEGRIRRNIIEADLVDCVIAMPGNLFYSTEIPVCLWFLARNKRAIGFRDRRGETLFIDASRLGVRIDRVHKEIPNQQIESIAQTYHAWRGDKEAEDYADIPGFSKKVTLDEIATNDYLLTPSLYVGIETNKQKQESLDQTVPYLLSALRTQFAEGARLQRLIEAKLREVGYGK